MSIVKSIAEPHVKALHGFIGNAPNSSCTTRILTDPLTAPAGTVKFAGKAPAQVHVPGVDIILSEASKTPSALKSIQA